MLPFIAIAVAAAAAAAGKLIYDAVTEDSSSSAPSSGSTQAELEKERKRRRSGERERLTKEACYEACSEMRLVLQTHGEVICGNAKNTVLLDDLRKVAAVAPNTDGLTPLKPLAVGLNYTRAHKTETHRIAQLKAEHASLQEFIRSL
jgi:hypothetical protein